MRRSDTFYKVWQNYILFKTWRQNLTLISIINLQGKCYVYILKCTYSLTPLSGCVYTLKCTRSTIYKYFSFIAYVFCGVLELFWHPKLPTLTIGVGGVSFFIHTRLVRVPCQHKGLLLRWAKFIWYTDFIICGIHCSIHYISSKQASF